MNNYKFIYEFTVDIEKEIEKTTVEEKDGVKTSTTTKVKELSPIFFAFKKPSRNERESADEYRAMYWSKYVEAGILPQAILLKKYANNGGILSDEDRVNYQTMQLDLYNKMDNQKELKILKPDDKDGYEKIMLEIIDLRGKILEFEKNQTSFFDNTAEAKSHIKYLEYLILNLCYTKSTSDGTWIQFFPGDTMNKKLDFLESLEENETHIYQKVKNKFIFLASIYVSLGGNVKKEDIDKFEKELSI